MANKTLFNSTRGRLAARADSINEAGGASYSMDAKHQLAQYAATGCLNSTFYAGAATQLDTVLELCNQVEPEFVARTALYCRNEGHMKDLPALLCAHLSVSSPGLLAEVFDRVIDSPKMLRNFVQIMRSGVVGRKSLGTLPKRLIRQWLENRSDQQVFFSSIGADPSLADVIKMVHPKPATPSREALYAYLIGRDHNAEPLPDIVQSYEAYKNNATTSIPDVPFQLLTSLPLDGAAWKDIARRAPWQTTRMNLNTYARHGVFDDPELVSLVAAKLANRALIERSRVFPYQLLMAYSMASTSLPQEILAALEAALEIACSNVPSIPGKTYVFVDVSGSMHSPVTGYRKGATSKVSCVDVAALVAACVLRRNPTAEVIPFSNDVVWTKLNPRDTVMTNAQKLSSLPAGGTNCAAPLLELNRRKGKADTVIYVSDNQSWLDITPSWWRQGTGTAQAWEAFKALNPRARMVCIDLQPYGAIVAKDQEYVLNIGGFSDVVFKVIGKFAMRSDDARHWTNVIELIAI